ncbi:MAG: DUF1622 domain-containing protein [Nitrosomonadales bacterium]|nr:DUF1622 domain-containing protein [Nitrosomonadales bacterium]
MHEFLVELVALIVPWTEALGIAIVMWGVVEGVVKLLARFRSLLDKASEPVPISHIRLAIGEKIALGLDFFLAGDIIQTIIIPSWESLAILGGIVIIRTVIAFFLNKDLKEFAEQK